MTFFGGDSFDSLMQSLKRPVASTAASISANAGAPAPKKTRGEDVDQAAVTPRKAPKAKTVKAFAKDGMEGAETVTAVVKDGAKGGV